MPKPGLLNPCMNMGGPPNPKGGPPNGLNIPDGGMPGKNGGSGGITVSLTGGGFLRRNSPKKHSTGLFKLIRVRETVAIVENVTA